MKGIIYFSDIWENMREKIKLPLLYIWGYPFAKFGNEYVYYKYTDMQGKYRNDYNLINKKDLLGIKNLIYDLEITGISFDKIEALVRTENPIGDFIAIKIDDMYLHQRIRIVDSGDWEDLLDVGEPISINLEEKIFYLSPNRTAILHWLAYWIKDLNGNIPPKEQKNIKGLINRIKNSL